MRLPLIATLLLLVACAPTSAARTGTASPRTTTAALTAADLRVRLFALSADSMMGRAPGDIGDFKAASYIAAESASNPLATTAHGFKRCRSIDARSVGETRSALTPTSPSLVRTMRRYPAMRAIAPSTG